MNEMTVQEMLKGVKYVTKRKLKRCTVAYVDDNNIKRIRFWRTDILTFYPNGRVKITLNGYWTPTTIQRVNQFIERGCYLHTRNKKRMLYSAVAGSDYIFEEGMIIGRDGIPLYGEKYDPKRRSKLNSLW